MKHIKTLYYLLIKRPKKGEIWRFYTKKFTIYADYEVVEIKKGFILYRDVLTREMGISTIFDFKIGMGLLENG